MAVPIACRYADRLGGGEIVLALSWTERREGTKSGKAIGRPKISVAREQAARALLVGGMGILKVAKTVGLGSGTVQSIRRAMA
jgi:hypothetical protein